MGLVLKLWWSYQYIVNTVHSQHIMANFHWGTDDRQLISHPFELWDVIHDCRFWLKLNHCHYCSLCSIMLYMTTIYIWPYMTTRFCRNIGLANGLLPDGNRWLPKPILTLNMICRMYLGAITQLIPFKYCKGRRVGWQVCKVQYIPYKNHMAWLYLVMFR